MTTENGLLPVSLDFVFKLIFNDPKNVDITQNFLSAVLNLPEEEFVSLKFINAELKRKFNDDKLSVLDVRVETAKKSDIAIEVQVAPDKAMASRALYYWSEMFSSNLMKSESYAKLPQTIIINILKFNMFQHAKYHSIFQIKEDTENIVLTDLLRIDFIELDKITNKPIDTKNSALQWMHFINTQDEGVLQMLSQQNPMIKKAVGVLKVLSADEQVRLEAQYRERAIRDEISRMESSRTEGIEIGEARGILKGEARGILKGEAIGEAKGEAKKAKEIAKNSLAIGLSIEQIQSITGLPKEEILALKQKFSKKQ
ncbi:MAG: Rpn family recombination-promoting nuclease/putative transposase [Eubacterium sp.]|jgi:predicted transposase/invertase (TIGR01784 family)|nr:Rpn family recombination-promoting nuclease/putative transposase [Eubacterium sp.]